MSERRQLALPFHKEEDYSEESFILGGGNPAAVEALLETDPYSWPDRRIILTGESGSGKTHLLHIWAARYGALSVNAGFSPLPLAEEAVFFALDDADLFRDEEAFFHFLNKTAERKAVVLLAARQPPALWPPVLPDLSSRLKSFLTVKIGPPDEAFLEVLLTKLCAGVGIRPDEEVKKWILKFAPREAGFIREIAAALKRYSSEYQKRITLPFAKEIFYKITVEKLLREDQSLRAEDFILPELPDFAGALAGKKAEPAFLPLFQREDYSENSASERTVFKNSGTQNKNKRVKDKNQKRK